MDWSKAYDCLPHDLFIAKLAAYGFGPNSLELISSYLSHRQQRVKIGSKFSERRPCQEFHKIQFLLYFSSTSFSTSTRGTPISAPLQAILHCIYVTRMSGDETRGISGDET